MGTVPYELYYWPGLPGRGHVLRMMLVDAGVDWVDVGQQEGVEAILRARQGDLGSLRPFAPPVLRHGALVLSQSAVIARYLGEQLGLASPDPVEAMHTQQVFLSWGDFVDEIHDTHHPIAVGRHYEEQKAAAKERAAYFLSERLPMWLGYFEGLTSRNAAGVCVGSEVSYADFAAALVLEGLPYAFPRAFDAHREQIPSLVTLHDRIAARPRLVAYRESPAWVGFNETGIFRHYPELDLPE